MTKEITIENIIVRMSPFSKELKEVCFNDVDFSKALKINNPHKFVSLGAVVISYPPLHPNDQIIGFYTYDYNANIPKFKQDFIVNIDSKNKEFILYTRRPKGITSKRIKDINEFFTKYSQGKYYIESHHPKFDELPEVIKPRAVEAVRLATKIKGGGLRQLTKEELEKIDKELTELNL